MKLHTPVLTLHITTSVRDMTSHIPVVWGCVCVGAWLEKGAQGSPLMYSMFALNSEEEYS